MIPIEKRQARLRQLCQALKEADADLIDVIQFGSSVYAPDLARDVDLLVTTSSKKDAFYRVAFDRLFNAARYAVMAYLNTDNSRWGQLRSALSPPWNEQFRRLINTLHIQYSYDGNYPQNDPDGAFTQWRQKVEQFIDRLEKLPPKQPQTP